MVAIAYDTANSSVGLANDEKGKEQRILLWLFNPR